jgi:hypothetical protein
VTRQALTDMGIKQAIILGGTNAISAATASELQQITGNAPLRWAGVNRYATATDVATQALAKFGFDKTGVLLAGTAGTEDFPDALAGAPLGGKNKTPILLTAPTTLSDATNDYLEAHSADVAKITAVGGTAAVTDAVLAAAKSAATPKPGTESIDVTPREEAFLPNATSSTREYTASGSTAAVDIVLVACDNVTDSTFANSNANNVADGTSAASSDTKDKAATTAKISSVNGTATSPLAANDDYADNVAPTAAGTVKFVISGPSSGTTCVVPVVFNDANNDNALNTDTKASAAATET